ncbi:sulfatase-like hydrolase/transferase [Pedobacter sp. SD-b]|uniref:Sulfatase-like hydrolase/transferase n=1 Tax=Pedobacter segetis TaxID=2793069 RepID=A0ABS1BGD8_9SPHI|nr:sulfatase-like hydrolase/transferase [Pedobacter segetis]MBK0381934.1 sulfatase-like hydrolase/transferase [Pedobacter segetis]
MKFRNYRSCFKVCFVVYLIGIATVYAQTSIKPLKKPNIIYILTDDLGYGDVGAFFQNLRQKTNDRSEPWTVTPHLDNMAIEGAMLTNHYVGAPVCAPSRASLLSGLSQGHANVRDNQFDKAIADNYTLGNVLQAAGYTTAAIGKWGLQGNKKWDKDAEKWPAYPLKRGFDYYMGYVGHGDGHEHYPKEGPSKMYNGGPKKVYEGYKEISQTLDKCYTGDLFTAYAKKYIVDHTKGKEKEKPFFMYLAFDTPHAVLELPTQAYPKGFGLRGGLQWTGKPGAMINTASGEVDSWMDPFYSNATYDDDKNPATPEVPWPNVYKRYATITKRIDNQVNDILVLLKDLGIDQNTLVVFSSDNGPSIESYLKEPYRADFFNSFGPFDGIKRDILEGGMREPTIAWWPGHIAARQVINSPSISYDWLPTFTDVAGLSAPVNTDGVSLLPSLTNTGKQDTSLIYSEYFENGKTPNYLDFASNNRGRLRKQTQMYRYGNYVGVRYDIKSADDDFEIYNVVNDPKQSKNLAASMPQLQNYLKNRVLEVRMPDSTAMRPYDSTAIAAITDEMFTKGLSCKNFDNPGPWISKISNQKANGESVVKTVDPSKFIAKKPQLLLYQGYINAPTDGKYTFYLKASNKAFVKIHDANVIDADYGYKGGESRESSINLKAGLHPIKIYFLYRPNIVNKLNISWEGPSTSKESINQTVYLH